MLSVGIGARQKLTKRISINIEYYYQIPGYKLEGTENALSAGFDIETGGHVFQLIFTNSTGIAENQYITKTTDSWSKGAIHFGFNIARVFTLRKPKFRSKAKFDKKSAQETGGMPQDIPPPVHSLLVPVR